MGFLLQKFLPRRDSIGGLAVPAMVKMRVALSAEGGAVTLARSEEVFHALRQWWVATGLEKGREVTGTPSAFGSVDRPFAVELPTQIAHGLRPGF